MTAWKLWYLVRDRASAAVRRPAGRPGAARRACASTRTAATRRARSTCGPILEKPTRGARLLLRPAAADGRGARHDRPLADRQHPFRELRRGRGARAARGRAVRRAAREDRAARSRCRPASRSSRRCASAGLRVPSSCESGTCGTCRTGLVDGEAEHRDLVLMPDEQGSAIMLCVSRVAVRRAGARPVSAVQHCARSASPASGRAFQFMRPTFRADPRVRARRRRGSARPRRGERFASEFGGRPYATVDELVRDRGRRRRLRRDAAPAPCRARRARGRRRPPRAGARSRWRCRSSMRTR